MGCMRGALQPAYGDGEGDLTLTVSRDLRHFRSLQMTGADREGQRVLLPL